MNIQWPLAASYFPVIINTGIAVPYSTLSLQTRRVFTDKMSILDLIFRQVLKSIVLTNKTDTSFLL